MDLVANHREDTEERLADEVAAMQIRQEPELVLSLSLKCQRPSIVLKRWQCWRNSNIKLMIASNALPVVENSTRRRVNAIYPCAPLDRRTKHSEDSVEAKKLRID